jgi:hypothetical protein
MRGRRQLIRANGMLLQRRLRTRQRVPARMMLWLLLQHAG